MSNDNPKSFTSKKKKNYTIQTCDLTLTKLMINSQLVTLTISKNSCQLFNVILCIPNLVPQICYAIRLINEIIFLWCWHLLQIQKSNNVQKIIQEVRKYWLIEHVGSHALVSRKKKGILSIDQYSASTWTKNISNWAPANKIILI